MEKISVNHDLHFALQCIIFVIAKREPGRGIPLLCIFEKEKMGFLSQFFQGAKIFLGVYCEKILSTYDFLRASEYFRRGADGFWESQDLFQILNFLKNIKTKSPLERATQILVSLHPEQKYNYGREQPDAGRAAALCEAEPARRDERRNQHLDAREGADV